MESIGSDVDMFIVGQMLKTQIHQLRVTVNNEPRVV